MQEFKALANRLADEAGEIIRKFYRRPFDIEAKEDETPVTIADRMVEKCLREIIEKERPKDGISGEEFGSKESMSGLVWVLDPIDGTKPFIIGRPTFGTLIALCEDETPVLGIIDQPILKERWIGLVEEPTTFNNVPCKTRSCPSLKKAICASTSPGMFFDNIQPDFIKKWSDSSNFMVWGGDCYSYGLLANGTIDIIIEADMQPYDFAALSPIVEGAGGKMCDWSGSPLSLSSDGRIVALGDADLWGEVKDLLG